LLIAAGAAAFRTSGISLEHERTVLAAQVKAKWDANQEVQRLLTEIDSVETTITRYNRLAWPVRVTQAVDAVGAAMPKGITLTSMLVTPREQKDTSAPTPAERAARAAATKSGNKLEDAKKFALVVELEGVARADKDVAQFVSDLDANPLFARVSLDYTRAGEVDDFDAREFRMTCEIDLSARFAFVDQPKEGE
jgi:hypothetical protein